MVGNGKKILLTVKQKLKWIESFQNGKSATASGDWLILSMKPHYWADLFRTLIDEYDKIVGLWEKIIMLLAVYIVSGDIVVHESINTGSVM